VNPADALRTLRAAVIQAPPHASSEQILDLVESDPLSLIFGHEDADVIRAIFTTAKAMGPGKIREGIETLGVLFDAFEAVRPAQNTRLQMRGRQDVIAEALSRLADIAQSISIAAAKPLDPSKQAS
jgi:hypothetical protein